MNITNILRNFNNIAFSEEEEMNSERAFIPIACVALGLLGNVLVHRYRFNIASCCQNIKNKISSSASQYLEVARTATSILFSGYNPGFPANREPTFLASDPLEEDSDFDFSKAPNSPYEDSNFELFKEPDPIEAPSISSEHSGNEELTKISRVNSLTTPKLGTVVHVVLLANRLLNAIQVRRIDLRSLVKGEIQDSKAEQCRVFPLSQKLAEKIFIPLFNESEGWLATLSKLKSEASEEDHWMIENSLSIIKSISGSVTAPSKNIFYMAADQKGIIHAVGVSTLEDKRIMLQYLATNPQNLQLPSIKEKFSGIRGSGTAIIQHLVYTAFLMRKACIITLPIPKVRSFYSGLGFQPDNPPAFFSFPIHDLRKKLTHTSV